MSQYLEGPRNLDLRNQLPRTWPSLLLGGLLAISFGLEFIKYISFEDLKRMKKLNKESRRLRSFCDSAL